MRKVAFIALLFGTVGCNNVSVWVDYPRPEPVEPGHVLTTDFFYPEEFFPGDYEITRPYITSLSEKSDGLRDLYGYFREGVDQRAILQLLREKRYEELTSLLEAFQRNFERDFHYEYRVNRGVHTFSVARPEIGALLDDWCAALPDRFPPHLARARHHISMAWKSRGTKWATETSREQFDEMGRYFDLAKTDLKTALDLNPGLVEGYNALIDIAAVYGDMKACDGLMEKADALCPNCYIVKANHLVSTVPRWGGSYERMGYYAQQAQQYVRQNPKLAVLQGYVYRDQAWYRFREGEYEQAAKLCDMALSFGDHATYLYDRARNYLYLDRYQEAIDDVEKAIHLQPFNPDFYELRSRARLWMGDIDAALADLGRAENAYTFPADIADAREQCFKDCLTLGNNRFKEDTGKAVKYYSAAIRMDEDNYEPWHWRAAAYYKMGNWVLAAGDYKEAIKRNPTHFESYRFLDYSLARSRDWDTIIAYWNRFLELEPDHPEALRELSGAYHHRGDRSKAQTMAQRACELGDVKACRYVSAAKRK